MAYQVSMLEEKIKVLRARRWRLPCLCVCFHRWGGSMEGCIDLGPAISKWLKYTNLLDFKP